MNRWCIFLWIFSYSILGSSQEEVLSSDEAFLRYQAISEVMAQSFPEDDINTFRRTSFSEEQLQTYLAQHLKRMDLLPLIKGHAVFKLHAYLHSGNWFRQIGFPKKSIEAYLDFFSAYEMHKNELSSDEKKLFYELQTFAHGILAENYAKIGKYEAAIKEHRSNLAFTEPFQDVFYASALNNFGLYYYLHVQKRDSAMHYFTKAYTLAQDKFPNHTLNGSIRDNIADIYIDWQEPAKALPLYRENFDFYQNTVNEKTRAIDLPRLISAGSQYTLTALDLNKIEEAQGAFLKLEEIVEDPRWQKTKSISSTLEFFGVEAQLLQKQGKYEAAYRTLLQKNRLSDSLQRHLNKIDAKWREELNGLLLDRIARNYEMDRIQKENERRIERNYFWMISLGFLTVIILLTSLYLRRKQYISIARNKQLYFQQQLENTKLRAAQLRLDIQHKERDLTDFAINLAQNQQWALALEEQLAKVKKARDEDREALIDQLELELKNKISFDDQTEEFMERLDRLSASFYERLNERFPNLTKNEVRLCSLIRLKMESRSIATLQNITLASVNTSRYRLRKRMQLNGDTDLDEFIQSL